MIQLDQKIRADEAFVLCGLCPSREQAKRLIMAAQAFAKLPGAKEVQLVQKPGQLLPAGSELSLKESERFVSRGAYKLLTALEAFQLDVQNLVALDAGASTGGFTDCLLQHGAARVYAVDVGNGQLDVRLRGDERVVCLEGVNLRHAPESLIPEPVDLLVADVSFISLTLIVPPCLKFMKKEAQVVVLVKPQFELGPQAVKGGVVREEALQLQAVDKIVTFARQELSLELVGVVPAKIKGPKGNQEYLAYFKTVEA